MKRSDAARIVVVAVTYESDASALQFVRNVAAVSHGDAVDIVVVDNSLRADSRNFFNEVLKANSNALCVKPESNLGYFGGGNYGLREYMKGVRDFEWAIISNVDIEVSDDFFIRLREMEAVDGVGVVAPSIWSRKSLRDQNPKMLHRPSSRKMKFYRLLYRSFIIMNLYGLLSLLIHSLKYLLRFQLLSRLLGARNVDSVPEKEVRPNEWKAIYAAQGASMVFSRRYFDSGGSLEYPMFLFYEEIFVAETVRKLGLSTYYNPSLKLFHEDHLSTGLFRSRMMGKYISNSINYIVDTYFV